MNRKNRNIAEWAFYALIGGLLIYAASRTLDFVQNTLAADKQFLGYLYLLATGIGAIIWLYVYLTYAEGSKQRAIAFIMGIADLIGEMVLVYADTVRVAAENGQMQMTDQEQSVFIIASVGVIGLNILAGYAFKLFDPNAEAAAHARDMADEVRDAAVKKMNTPAEKTRMANELAPILEAAMFEQVEQEIRAAAGQYKATPIKGTVFDRRTHEADTVPLPTITTEPAQDYTGIAPELYAKGTRFTDPADQARHDNWHADKRDESAGAPDNYGPLWHGDTNITPTLDKHNWVCLCHNRNMAGTRKCWKCGQSRTNASPVTAFFDAPAKQDEPISAMPPFRTPSE